MGYLMFTVSYWRDVLERAIKTAAQTAVIAIGAAAGFDLFTADFTTIGGAAAGGFVLSVLTSIGSAPFGTNGSPSLLSNTWTSIGANGSVTNG
jgi:hypothetical protein